MSGQPDDKAQQPLHPAAWRGDLRPLWVLIALFAGLILAVGIAVEYPAGFLEWLIVAGVLAAAWGVAVILLVRWSAAAGTRPSRRQESSVRRKSS